VWQATVLVTTCALAMAAAAPACAVDTNVGARAAAPSDGAPSDAPEGGDGRAPTPEDPDGAATDASSNPGCGISFPQEGDWIEAEIVEEVSSFGSGGTIAPGTYVLTTLRSYLGGPRGTQEIRETIVLRGSPTIGTMERLTEARNASGQLTAHAPRGETLTWEAAPGPAAFFRDTTCPESSLGTGSYDADATTLTLYESAVVRIYARVR
jgi:hypothetical protein